MLPANAPSLRELVVLFDTRLQQLTVANLVNGFFPAHTLAVSIAATIVCWSLALGQRDATIAAPRLFASFTSFAALSLAALMTATLLFRLTGGRFAFSPRATGDVVEWLLDAVSRPLVEDTAKMLLTADRRRERACFFAALCLMAEVGKVFSFWTLCTLVSLVWLGCTAQRMVLGVKPR